VEPWRTRKAGRSRGILNGAAIIYTALVSRQKIGAMRDALLHQGSTRTRKHRGKERARYRYFSFIDPIGFSGPGHEAVDDTNGIITINIDELASETLAALHHWFTGLAGDAERMKVVETQLPTLARLKPKAVPPKAPDGDGVVPIGEHCGVTTSST